MESRITLNFGNTHQINPKIYGHFIEELGDCIHNGIWVYDEDMKSLDMVEQKGPNSQLHFVREDVFTAIQNLCGEKNGEKPKQTILRWPGGCFSDTYHWKDGIGPRN